MKSHELLMNSPIVVSSDSDSSLPTNIPKPQTPLHTKILSKGTRAALKLRRKQRNRLSDAIIRISSDDPGTDMDDDVIDTTPPTSAHKAVRYSSNASFMNRNYQPSSPHKLQKPFEDDFNKNIKYAESTIYAKKDNGDLLNDVGLSNSVPTEKEVLIRSLLNTVTASHTHYIPERKEKFKSEPYREKFHNDHNVDEVYHTFSRADVKLKRESIDEMKLNGFENDFSDNLEKMNGIDLKKKEKYDVKAMLNSQRYGSHKHYALERKGYKPQEDEQMDERDNMEAKLTQKELEPVLHKEFSHESERRYERKREYEWERAREKERYDEEQREIERKRIVTEEEYERERQIQSEEKRYSNQVRKELKKHISVENANNDPIFRTPSPLPKSLSTQKETQPRSVLLERYSSTQSYANDIPQLLFKQDTRPEPIISQSDDLCIQNTLDNAITEYVLAKSNHLSIQQQDHKKKNSNVFPKPKINQEALLVVLPPKNLNKVAARKLIPNFSLKQTKMHLKNRLNPGSFPMANKKKLVRVNEYNLVIAETNSEAEDSDSMIAEPRKLKKIQTADSLLKVIENLPIEITEYETSSPDGHEMEEEIEWGEVVPPPTSSTSHTISDVKNVGRKLKKKKRELSDHTFENTFESSNVAQDNQKIQNGDALILEKLKALLNKQNGNISDEHFFKDEERVGMSLCDEDMKVIQGKEY